MLLGCVFFTADATAGATEDTELAKAVKAHQFHPSVLGPESWEGYKFSDMEIRIKESTDLYGAVLWPSVLTDLHNITTVFIVFAASPKFKPPTGNGVVSFPRDKPGQIQLEGQKCY